MYHSSTIAPPPPPYTARLPRTTHPTPSQRASFASLPVHLVHRILVLTLDQKATPSRFWQDPEEERVRRVWALFRGLRGVNRIFWLVATSILRALYLEPYLTQIRHPFSADPFPYESSHLGDPSSGLTVDPASLGSVYASRGRETAVFDRFIAVRVGEELRRVESELSEGSEAEMDIFARLQPAARIEDLLLTLPPSLLTPPHLLPAPLPPPTRSIPLPHPYLSVSLTPTWAQLYIHGQAVVSTEKPVGRELVVEVRRTGGLEGTVRRLEEGLDSVRLRVVPWGGRAE
ncbi:hypothetical protein IAT38_007061 [Cryptococcus sp. DSM 104549]